MNWRGLDCAFPLKVGKVVTHVFSMHIWNDFSGTDTKYLPYIIVIQLEILIVQCYYLGGLEDSATGILGELSKPLSWSMPADKVCEKLKKKDSQVCDLRYGKFLLLAYMAWSVSCLYWNPVHYFFEGHWILKVNWGRSVVGIVRFKADMSGSVRSKKLVE